LDESAYKINAWWENLAALSVRFSHQALDPFQESKDFYHGEGREPRRITKQASMALRAVFDPAPARSAEIPAASWSSVALGLLRGEILLLDCGR
jgi:hypothetical protein